MLCFGKWHIETVISGRPLPSFPRKRESSGCLSRPWCHKAVPFGIPAYAGMTVGGLREGRFLCIAGLTRPHIYHRPIHIKDLQGSQDVGRQLRPLAFRDAGR